MIDLTRENQYKEITNILNMSGKSSLIFIFGEKFLGKSTFIEKIEKGYKTNDTNIAINISELKRYSDFIIKYSYFFAIIYLLNNANKNIWAKLFDLSQSNNSIFTSWDKLRWIRKTRKFMDSELVLNSLKNLFGNISSYKLRDILYKLTEGRYKFHFFFDDCIIDDILIKDLLDIDDNLITNYIFTLQPSKKLSLKLDKLFNNSKTEIYTYNLRPLLSNTSFNKHNEFYTPIIPGLFVDKDFLSHSNEELYEKTINNSYYSSIEIDQANSPFEQFIFAYILGFGKISQYEISQIISIGYHKITNWRLINRKASIWKINSNFMFLDGWREYLIICWQFKIIIREFEKFFFHLLNISLKEPDKVSMFKIVRSDNHSFWLNPNLTSHYHQFFDCFTKIITRKRKESYYLFLELNKFIYKNEFCKSIEFYNFIYLVFKETQELSILDYVLQEFDESDGIIVDNIIPLLEKAACVCKKWNDLTMFINLSNFCISLVEKRLVSFDSLSLTFNILSLWNNEEINEIIKNLHRSSENNKSLFEFGIDDSDLINILREDLMNNLKLRPFIVHGHDKSFRLEVKNFLQNTIKTEEPIILAELAGKGRTIIEKFEEESLKVDVVFVLLSPDDFGGAKDSESQNRARQNVIFELGYFVGLLGRNRVILIRKGEVEIPSDLHGVERIDLGIADSVESQGEKIRKELSQLDRLNYA